MGIQGSGSRWIPTPSTLQPLIENMQQMCKAIDQMQSLKHVESETQATFPQTHSQAIYFDDSVGVLHAILWSDVVATVYPSNIECVFDSTKSEFDNSNHGIAWTCSSFLLTSIGENVRKTKDLSHFSCHDIPLLFWFEWDYFDLFLPTFTLHWKDVHV